MSRSTATDWDTSLRPFLDGADGDVWRAYCDRLHEELVDRWLSRDPVARVLKTDLFDEAAGAGLVRALGGRASQLHALDVSVPVASRAASKNPEGRFVTGDVRRLPYPDAAFDLIFSNSTLDHFPARGDIERAVSELNRVLKPGGRLLVSFDNLANPVIALRAAIPFGWLHGLGLVPYYVGKTVTMGGLERLLGDAGFELERSGFLMHVPRVLAVPLCRRLRGRPAGDVAGWWRTFRFFERLDALPTRCFTGHFAAALAVKRASTAPSNRASQ